MRKGDQVWAVYRAWGQSPMMRFVTITAVGSKRIRTNDGVFDRGSLWFSRAKALRRFRKMLKASIAEHQIDIQQLETKLQATSELIEKICPACGEEGDCVAQCPHAGMPRDVDMDDSESDGPAIEDQS